MNTAYNMDCMEYMRALPDKAFDLAVVDPPYGINMDGQHLSVSKNGKIYRKNHKQKEWDRHIPPNTYFRELERVSKKPNNLGRKLFCERINAKPQRMDCLV